MNKEPQNNQAAASPLVSVAVPVYNGAAFIEDCLESILNQTFTDWQCIVVNNRSTDGTAGIVQRFQQMDPRFKLIHYDEFVPLVDNWNRLYSNISHDSVYLKVVQADDIIYPEALEEMVGILEAHPEAGLCTSYRIDGLKIDGGGLNYFRGPVFPGKELLYRHLKSEIDISGSVTTPLFRKSVLEKLPTFPKIFDDLDYHMDTLLVYEIMNMTDIAFVFKVLSVTRVHEGADTVQTAVRFRTFACSKEYRLSKFRHLSPDLEKVYRRHRLSYAYFLIKERLKGHRDCIEWHKKHMVNSIQFREYVLALLVNNGISWRLLAPFRRRSGKHDSSNIN